MDLIKELESQQLKKEMPVINVGDTVRVHVKIKEGSRERIQVFEGIVIAKKRGGRAAPAGDRAGLCSRAPKRGLRRGNERFPLISAVFLQIMLAFPLGM